MGRENTGTNLLDDEDNQEIFRIMGPRCQALVTTVAQIYETKEPYHNKWIKSHTGVLVLTKDFLRKDYFLRIYCLEAQRKIWEHGMYLNMEYTDPKPFLHVFEGENRMIALNFVNTEEASSFKMGVLKVLDLINKKLQPKEQTPINSSTIPMPTYNYDKTSRKKSKKSKKNKNKNKSVINKLDISGPINFQHVSHVGFNEQGLTSRGDSAVAKFLQDAGLTESQLRNTKVTEVINNFFKENGGEDVVLSKQEQFYRVSSIISPPMNNNNNSNAKFVNAPNVPPPPPPPSMTNVNANIPLAPPPPLPPADIALTENTSSSPQSNNNDRSNLLMEIQKGIKLKPSEDREIKNSSSSVKTQEESSPQAVDMVRLLKEKLKDRRVFVDESENDTDCSEDEWSA